MAWQLVRHAFVMIFGNLCQALRVSVIPYAILIAAWTLVFVTSGLPLTTDPEVMAASGGNIGAMTLLLFLALIVFSVFVFGWVAVSWHRFILCEEYTAFVPAISDRPIWPYIGRSFLLGLLITVIAIPVFIVVGLLSAPFAEASMVVPFIAALAGISGLAYLWMRWAIVLPSTAIGVPMTGSEAWAATAPHAQTIFVVVLILMAINVIPAVLLQGVYAAAPIIGVVVDVVIQWVTIMLGLSILTTLYGHIVEGRSLED